MTIPERIGRYRIVRILGQGGMGVVYHAHDELLDRPVAIKVVATAHANEIGRQRLQREAKAAASIRHPHICQIYDIGEENGDPFIAMELLEGESLSERLARGALPVPDAIGLALQVLDALNDPARARHRAPRPQALQCVHDGPWGQAARLRPGAAHHDGCAGQHADRRCP